MEHSLNGDMNYEEALRAAKNASLNNGAGEKEALAIAIKRSLNDTKKRPREEEALKQSKDFQEKKKPRRGEDGPVPASAASASAGGEAKVFQEMHFFHRPFVGASSLTTTAAPDWTPLRTTMWHHWEYRGMTHQSKAVELSHKNPGSNIGLLICGNSGLPAGHLGYGVTVKAYQTQEEDVMMAVLLAETGCTNWAQARGYGKKAEMDQFVQDHLAGKWGMTGTRGNATLQGVDYVACTDPAQYGSAWSLRNCRIVGKTKTGEDGLFELHKVSLPNICLTFVAGPNAGAYGKENGTMARTLNSFCETRTQPPTPAGYKFLENGTQAAIRAGLLSMIENECCVALCSGVSSGIYAGKYKTAAEYEWPKTEKLVQNVLNEDVPGRPGTKIGHCFYQVYF